MPNPGGIHLGCERCRQRRIKCDRASPNCRRCTIHGMPCPGYPQTLDVIFRHETLKTVRKARAGASFQGAAVLEEQTSTHAFNAARQRVLSLPICASLSSSDTLTSTCYFIHQLVIPVGWYPLIPKLYQESAPVGCLRWAVEAASMFLYANKVGKNQLFVRARILYSSALNATNVAISDPFERLKDETICAILVLNIIDDITGEMSFVSGTHVDGCRELLIQREAESFKSSSASDLVLSVLIQTQAQVMRNHQTLSPGSLHWLSKQHPGTLAAIVLAECINIQQLRLNFFNMLSRSSGNVPEDFSRYTDILDAVESIDTRLTQLASRFGGRWDIHQIPQSTQIGNLAPVGYYHDIQVAKVWNQQRSARIALHEFQLAICEELQVQHQFWDRNDMEILRRRSVEIIASMSSEICRSIPFHLRQVDANGRKCSSDAQKVTGGCALIWPLETIANCRYNGEDHRLMARATLAEIGHAIGVRQATRKLSELSLQHLETSSSQTQGDMDPESNITGWSSVQNMTHFCG